MSWRCLNSTKRARKIPSNSVSRRVRSPSTAGTYHIERQGNISFIHVWNSPPTLLKNKNTDRTATSQIRQRSNQNSMKNLPPSPLFFRSDSTDSSRSFLFTLNLSNDSRTDSLKSLSWIRTYLFRISFFGNFSQCHTVKTYVRHWKEKNNSVKFMLDNIYRTNFNSDLLLLNNCEVLTPIKWFWY